MKTQTKLATLELIGGIFGWAWIGLGIAALVLFVMALFFEGSWAHFLWALGGSIVCKWLLRGFLDNQRRVAFEAELVAKRRTK